MMQNRTSAVPNRKALCSEDGHTWWGYFRALMFPLVNSEMTV